MDFLKSMAIAATGLRAQAGRMRIISENIANADSTPSSPGANPYRRKIPTFQMEFDSAVGANVVELGKTVTDMREAQRSYQANINVITASRRMLLRTLDILKACRLRERSDPWPPRSA